MSKFEKEFEAFFSSRGLDFIRNDKTLKGTPDFTFYDGKIALFLHGCFWHGHTCKTWNLDKIWNSRINNTIEKDFLVRKYFLNSDIQYFRIWECEYQQNRQVTFSKIYKEITLQQPDSYNSKRGRIVLETT
jgi:DNA mismatch endonuclease (patch repair protein)